MRVSAKYQDIVKDAVDGHYDDVFFGDMDVAKNVDHESNIRRLRAVVQYFNLQFDTLMRRYGQQLP